MEPDTSPIPSVEDNSAMPSVDWLKWLGERRDGFLVGGAVLYGLGYLVWSYNAWRNHLGQLPAFEFQYVIAGLIPGAIMGFAWAVSRIFSKIRDKTAAVFKKYPFLSWVLISIIVILQLTIILGDFATSKGWLKAGLTKGQLTRYTAPIVLVAIYFHLLSSLSRLKTISSKFRDWVTSFYSYTILALLCWYALVIYFDLYPRLPQALGGPQPRCAYVDLVREDVAPSSLSIMVPARPLDSATTSESKVVRTNKLNVYFSSSDYLLIRTAADTGNDGGANLKNAPLYELRREVIRVVQWCPE